MRLLPALKPTIVPLSNAAPPNATLGAAIAAAPEGTRLVLDPDGPIASADGMGAAAVATVLAIPAGLVLGNRRGLFAGLLALAIANPIAAVWSAALMLDHLGLPGSRGGHPRDGRGGAAAAHVTAGELGETESDGGGQEEHPERSTWEHLFRDVVAGAGCMGRFFIGQPIKQ